jgi:hypothetical protein
MLVQGAALHALRCVVMQQDATLCKAALIEQKHLTHLQPFPTHL